MYIIHSKIGCPWCVKAKELMQAHNIKYEEHMYDTPEKITQFKAQGFKTFPQIYNDKGQHIGGFEALEAYLGNDDF